MALIYRAVDETRADSTYLIARNRALRLVACMALALAGCGSTVTMEMPTSRSPIEKIPVDVAVRIPAEFDNFVHVRRGTRQETPGRSTWVRSNAAFFAQLFGYMFDSVMVLGPDDDARDYQFDALIEPSIDGFEFSVPTTEPDRGVRRLDSLSYEGV